MKRKVFVAVMWVTIVVSLTISGVTVYSDHKPNIPSETSSCKEALREQWYRSLVYNEVGNRPLDCEGFTDEELQRLAHEVLDEEMAR